MDEFPASTIIAHVETKKEMDRFGPGSVGREEKTIATFRKMLETGRTRDGQVLSDDDKAEVKKALARQIQWTEEIREVKFQSATLTFEHDFSVDIGNREVQVKF
jgi:hypothetical protein